MHTHTVLVNVLTCVWYVFVIIFWIINTKLCLHEDGDGGESDILFACRCIGYTFFTIGLILMLIGGIDRSDMTATISGFVLLTFGHGLILYARLRHLMPNVQ